MAEERGRGTSVNWPAGVGGKGNEGVAGLVKQTPGAIGYVEPIYANQNKLPYGVVQNSGGSSSSRARVRDRRRCGAAGKMPDDFRVSITNPPGKDAYPIASFTWLLLYEAPKDKAAAKPMVEFMKWALTDGQKFATELGYSPLPEASSRWNWKRWRRSQGVSRRGSDAARANWASAAGPGRSRSAR